MSRFVLVHGAWHGAWCWYKIIPLLERAGHAVSALDLPGLGQDTTPLSQVTLERYARSVCDALGSGEPAILVGHSMGGIAITAAAQLHPERIERLVYVAAFLLRDAESLIDVATQSPNPARGLAVRSADRLTTSLNPGMIRELLYAQCPDEDVALARLLLRPQVVLPMATPQHSTAERAGCVPRVYIECLRDRVIEPDTQKRMIESSPCSQVASLDTDHSPFFSRPQQLAGLLLDL